MYFYQMNDMEQLEQIQILPITNCTGEQQAPIFE